MLFRCCSWLYFVASFVRPSYYLISNPRYIYRTIRTTVFNRKYGLLKFSINRSKFILHLYLGQCNCRENIEGQQCNRVRPDCFLPDITQTIEPYEEVCDENKLVSYNHHTIAKQTKHLFIQTLPLAQLYIIL